MKKKDAIKYYGSEANIARTLKISRQAVNKWGKVVPVRSAIRLTEKADGMLDFKPGDYR